MSLFDFAAASAAAALELAAAAAMFAAIAASPPPPPPPPGDLPSDPLPGPPLSPGGGYAGIFSGVITF